MRILLLSCPLSLLIGSVGCDKGDLDDTGSGVSDGGGDASTSGGDTGGTGGGDTGSTGGDTGGDTGGGDTGGGNTGGGTGGDTGDTGGAPEQALCDDGLPVRDFDPSGSGADFDELVGDFTVQTTDGPWSLSERWTGCDSYIFLNYHDGVSYSWLWLHSDFVDWLESSPTNVHYFFSSLETEPAAIEDDLLAIQVEVEQALGELDEDLADHWRDRIHYLTDSAFDLGGGIGTIFTDYYNTYAMMHLGIDRRQTFRELGYLADPLYSWSRVPIRFAAYEAAYYNFEAWRDDRLEREEATVLRAFDDEYIADTSWAGLRGSATVRFPDAAELAGYDTMELDLRMRCEGHPEASSCGEWDYLVYAYLCDVDDPATEAIESDACVEFGRFITTYARPGRWVTDATPFLALLRDGGEHTVEFYTTQGYYVTLDIRLSSRGLGYRPSAMDFLWSGGYLTGDYNDEHPPLRITPPEGTSRVAIAALISGHGYSSDPNYCGEFCNHESHFRVDGGAEYIKDHPEVADYYGCAAQVVDGTVPNQWGTWVFGRGGWCPGLEVQPWLADITADVTIGAENSLEYWVTIDGVEPSATSTDGRIDMQSYAVYYE